MKKEPSEDAEDKRTVRAIVLLAIIGIAVQIAIGILAVLTE